jgi:ketosteroid isomerase-like protein
MRPLLSLKGEKLWGNDMRRDELTQAFENLRRALSQAKIHQVLSAAMRVSSKSEAGASANTYQAYATFMTAYASFGDAEKTIMAALKLTPLASPEFWTKLATRDPGSGSDISETRLGSLLVRDFFPALEKLLKRTTDQVGMSFEGGEKPGQSVEARKIRF